MPSTFGARQCEPAQIETLNRTLDAEANARIEYETGEVQETFLSSVSSSLAEPPEESPVPVMLERYARKAGQSGTPWVNIGNVGFIEAAKRWATAHNERFGFTRDVSIDVYCSSNPHEVVTFHLERQVSWTVLNPRLGAE